jgi:hypothetical protein
VCCINAILGRYLNESSVLHTLQQRYANNLIHTFGGPTLITINPAKPLAIYSDKIISMFKVAYRFDCFLEIYCTTPTVQCVLLLRYVVLAIFCVNLTMKICFIIYISCHGVSIILVIFRVKPSSVRCFISDILVWCVSLVIFRFKPTSLVYFICDISCQAYFQRDFTLVILGI